MSHIIYSMNKLSFKCLNCPKTLKTEAIKAIQIVIIYLWKISKNLCKLEGPRINIVVVVFKRVNKFVFCNLGA